MQTLFVVDDNTIDQFIMMSNLKTNSIFDNIVRFNGGKSIIDHLISNKGMASELPEVIFLDLNMPEFDGWDVLEALENVYPLLVKQVITYIISASINPKDRSKAMKYHFVKNFFSKPICKENFSTILHDVQSYL
jgi:response regulator RpfG family c-di-GMP phosphodiesterase